MAKKAKSVPKKQATKQASPKQAANPAKAGSGVRDGKQCVVAVKGGKPQLAIASKAGRGGKTVAVPVAEPAERDGVKYGITTGLRITNFVNELLMANRQRQLPDGELQAALAAEYPKRPSLQAMASWRAYFNKGLHGHGHNGIQVVQYGERQAAETSGKLVRKNAEYQQKYAEAKAAKGSGNPVKKAAKGAKGAKGVKKAPTKKGTKKAPAKVAE